MELHCELNLYDWSGNGICFVVQTKIHSLSTKKEISCVTDGARSLDIQLDLFW